MTSAKKHLLRFPLRTKKTACGKRVGILYSGTINPAEVTCPACRRQFEALCMEQTRLA